MSTDLQSLLIQDVREPRLPLGRVHRSSGVARAMQLATVLAGAVTIAAIGSHLVASWVKVKTRAAELFVVGGAHSNPPTFLAGSSVANYGISGDEISTQLDSQIKVWGIAGGSPVEWEQFQKQVPEAQTTLIIISAVDLDEALFSDFRAAIVPLGDAIKTLSASHADWNCSRRVLSQYPITWLRVLFPTLGRSRGIMGDLRIKIANLIKPSSRESETQVGPTIKFTSETFDDEYKRQRMSEWSESKILSKVVAMDVGFQGPHAFNGLKKFAFERMLRYGDSKGRTFVVVLPVSPAYAKAFLPPDTARKFEDALYDLQRSAPRSEWLRLDQVAELSSADNFCDVSHSNIFGRQIATKALRIWLSQVHR